MGRNAHELGPCLPGAAVQFQREHQVGELGLAVCAAAVIRALGLQIAKVDAAAAMRDACYGNDTGGRRLQQRGDQQPGQREMPQMIGAELPLEPVGGYRTVGLQPQSGIVEQDVDPRNGSSNAFGKRPDGSQAGQVQRADRHLCAGMNRSDARRTGFPAHRVAYSQYGFCAMAGQRKRGFVADAAGCTRHDRDALCQVGYLACRPGGHRQSPAKGRGWLAQERDFTILPLVVANSACFLKIYHQCLTVDGVASGDSHAYEVDSGRDGWFAASALPSHCQSGKYRFDGR